MFASKHSCHDIPTRGYSHSLHTYKRTFTPWHTPERTFTSWHTLNETFASQLNMCTSAIIDKLCICTPAGNICIINKKLHLHLRQEALTSEMKNRLALHFVCIHRKLTSKSVVKGLSIACEGTMFAYHIGKTNNGISSA